MSDIPLFRPAAAQSESPSEPFREPPRPALPLFQPGVTPMSPGPIKTWSASALKKFESCPLSLYLSKVGKFPDPSGPAAERGTQVHQMAEDFVGGKLDDIPKELSKAATTLRELRELHGEGKVSMEGEWGYTRDWAPTAYFGKDVWLRAKLDVYVQEDDTSARVIDWKTGRKFGNEYAHASQAMIYAVATFMRFPRLQALATEFHYTDQGEITIQRYSRQQAMELQPRITTRALKLTTCHEFVPRPSTSNCRWCPHAKVQDGYTEPACQFAITP